MPFPLGADDDVCLVGAHRLLPLFSCGGSGIRFALMSSFSLMPIQLSGIVFDDTHFVCFHDLTLFHLQLRG